LAARFVEVLLRRSLRNNFFCQPATELEFQEKQADMIGQKRGQVRTQDPGEEIAKIWLQNSARDAAIGAHQIDDIACKRRQVATCGEGIENCAQSLLHPPPVRAGDMRQDVANMRLAPKGGNDDESEIADGDLPIVMGQPWGDPGTFLPCTGNLIGSPWICLAIPISWSITAPIRYIFNTSYNVSRAAQAEYLRRNIRSAASL
jgi:hypothetical protein